VLILAGVAVVVSWPGREVGEGRPPGSRGRRSGATPPSRPGATSRARRARGADTARMIRRVTATRYVTPLREGGSLPAIVEADDDACTWPSSVRRARREGTCRRVDRGRDRAGAGLARTGDRAARLRPASGGRRARRGDPGTAPAKQRHQRGAGLPPGRAGVRSGRRLPASVRPLRRCRLVRRFGNQRRP